MDELVQRLSNGSHAVETARPEKTSKSLKECIDRGYVHVNFMTTGTELGTKLDLGKCNFQNCDFEKGEGKIHLEGGLTLNYVKVKLTAEVDLGSLQGTGQLVAVDDAEYARIMNKN